MLNFLFCNFGVAVEIISLQALFITVVLDPLITVVLDPVASSSSVKSLREGVIFPRKSYILIIKISHEAGSTQHHVK